MKYKIPLCLFLCISHSLAYFDDYFLPEKAVDVDSRGRVINEDELDYEDNPQEPIDKPTGYFCNLCFVIDEEFSHAYNLTHDSMITAAIEKIVNEASWILRSQDLDNDGKVDNVGLKTSKISYGWKPYRHETKEHYEKPKVASDLLKVFARLNFSQCCLGVGFTNRPFLNGQDGIAFGAAEHLHGGICDHRNPKGESMASTNVILLSGRGMKGNTSIQLTPLQIGRAFLHELGHSFGAHSHDSFFNDPDCWGFRPDERPIKKDSKPKDGRFIMWGKGPQNVVTTPVASGLKKNNFLFSRCSKTAVGFILNNRKNRERCFEVDYNPFCGNGLLEGMEMCDCGNEYECAHQKCCGARNSPRPCEVLDLKVCPQNVVTRMGARLPDINSTAVIKNAKMLHGVLANIVVTLWANS